MTAPMYARQNNDGVSVNESAVCANCLNDDDALEASFDLWMNAEDTDENGDDELYPIDNPDGVCAGCGSTSEYVA